jgi:hypothetical protein
MMTGLGRMKMGRHAMTSKTKAFAKMAFLLETTSHSNLSGRDHGAGNVSTVST